MSGNANDGTSSYQMVPGFFRFVCANGPMVGDSFNEVKVRHTGDAIHEVIEGAPNVAEQVECFKSISLDEAERKVFAHVVHELRFPEAHKEGGKPAPVQAEVLLKTRHSGDRLSDLWTVGNVLQENIIRGGLQAQQRLVQPALRSAFRM
ncbi:DUF932 domain-containing protein [uncultured Tateyamaria sp.]|uniref:DUF932 domain-containing protein n=1 Tax=uncultured Tateyamaria sp. TaxID=455651 RepID=UPI002625E88F|nr:DUF932 domain-containing protein [uncultured Tateyamaria sp.]